MFSVLFLSTCRKDGRIKRATSAHSPRRAHARATPWQKSYFSAKDFNKLNSILVIIVGTGVSNLFPFFLLSLTIFQHIDYYRSYSIGLPAFQRISFGIVRSAFVWMCVCVFSASHSLSFHLRQQQQPVKLLRAFQHAFHILSLPLHSLLPLLPFSKTFFLPSFRYRFLVSQ